MLKYKYLSPEYENNIRSYKYVGGDNSYLYSYIFSPIANFCVNYIVPEWLAYKIFFNKLTINLIDQIW